MRTYKRKNSLDGKGKKSPDPEPGVFISSMISVSIDSINYSCNF